MLGRDSAERFLVFLGYGLQGRGKKCFPQWVELRGFALEDEFPESRDWLF